MCDDESAICIFTLIRYPVVLEGEERFIRYVRSLQFKL